MTLSLPSSPRTAEPSSRKSLGPLAAPVDLVPKRVRFTLPLPEPPAAGWRLVLDPDNKVPEIYEGNNEVKFVVTP